MQKDTLIEQSLTIRNIAVTALLEYLNLHAFLCLQVAIAAGDYLSSNLMSYSIGSLLLQWAATAKSILAVHPSSAAIQRGFLLIHLVNSKDYHYKTMYMWRSFSIV